MNIWFETETRIYYEAILEALGENETVSGKACRLFQALGPQRPPEPPPPMDIKVFASTPHSLSLNWSIPHWGEGITYYTVRYHVKDDDRKIMYERRWGSLLSQREIILTVIKFIYCSYVMMIALLFCVTLILSFIEFQCITWSNKIN